MDDPTYSEWGNRCSDWRNLACETWYRQQGLCTSYQVDRCNTGTSMVPPSPGDPEPFIRLLVLSCPESCADGQPVCLPRAVA